MKMAAEMVFSIPREQPGAHRAPLAPRRIFFFQESNTAALPTHSWHRNPVAEPGQALLCQGQGSAMPGLMPWALCGAEGGQPRLRDPPCPPDVAPAVDHIPGAHPGKDHGAGQAQHVSELLPLQLMIWREPGWSHPTGTADGFGGWF